MTDFPGHPAPKTILSSVDQIHPAHSLMAGPPSAGAVWPAANRAIYCPFVTEEIVTVTQLAILPTVQSGNFDVGIYTETGARLVSAGSTAMAAAGAVQAVDVADTLLTPGAYFLALCIDNTTAAVQRSNPGSINWQAVLSMQQQAVGAVTLPDPATFAAPATAYLPVIQAILMSAVI